MWAALWWIAKVSLKVTLWTATHPVAAIVVGAGMAAGGAWLSKQSWAGAKVLGGLVGSFGIQLLYGGIGAWATGKVLGKTGALIGAVVAPPWFRSGMKDLSIKWWKFW